MVNQSDVVYQYDGTFAGLMCCVFESFTRRELPLDIVSPQTQQLLLYPVREIHSNPEAAQRVLRSIPIKMGGTAAEFLEQSYLTCLQQKELHILNFLRLGYKHGPKVMHMLTHDAVDILFKAVTHLKRESHLLMGFARFSDLGGVLVAEIEPKNRVLPLLQDHFCQRFPEERFLIHDRTHGEALLYQPKSAAIIPVWNLELRQPDAQEQQYRELWRLFYDTIEVEGRHNPRCRMSHMPKRYWKHMTEFGGEDSRHPPATSRQGNGGAELPLRGTRNKEQGTTPAKPSSPAPLA